METPAPTDNNSLGLRGENPFAYCNRCYPLATAPDSQDQDPDPDCPHEGDPFSFLFPRLTAIIQRPAYQKTRLFQLFDAIDPGVPIEPASMSLYSLLFCSSAARTDDFPRVPRAPPPGEPSGVWGYEFLSEMAAKYQFWGKNIVASLRDMVVSLQTMHSVTSNLSFFVNKNLPLARQWLPCYAPAFYVSFPPPSAYFAVPVPMAVATLEDFDHFMRNDTGANHLEESRQAMSDRCLQSRIEDLENRVAAFPRSCLELEAESEHYIDDVRLLLGRYKLELTLRRTRKATLLDASYKFGATRNCISACGSMTRQHTCDERYFLTASVIAGEFPMFRRNRPMPIGDELARRIQDARSVPTDYRSLEMLSTLLCGKLDPAFLVAYLESERIGSESERITETDLVVLFDCFLGCLWPRYLGGRQFPPVAMDVDELDCDGAPPVVVPVKEVFSDATAEPAAQADVSEDFEDNE